LISSWQPDAPQLLEPTYVTEESTLRKMLALVSAYKLAADAKAARTIRQALIEVSN
jgi:hypothetical protein